MEGEEERDIQEETRRRIEEETAAKEAAKALQKIYKPGLCMKHMYVEVHPRLLECWYAADIEREVTLLGAHMDATAEICDPRLVMWSRRVVSSLRISFPLCAQVKLNKNYEACSQCLLVVPMAELAPLIQANTLVQHVSEQVLLTGRALTLVVFGAKDYRRSHKNQQHVTEMDLEIGMVDLLVSTGCDTLQVDTPNMLALLIARITKAAGEELYKKAKRICDSQARFYMRGDNKKCVVVDRQGNGLRRLWEQMLAMLPLSSLQISRAVAAEYPSPTHLRQALLSPGGMQMIADIVVNRTAVPGATSRRVGIEFARKLYTLFASDNGNALLG